MQRCAIVGGGVGGLTAARALQQVGIEVSVYEASENVPDRGLGLWPKAQCSLRNLGDRFAGRLDEISCRSPPAGYRSRATGQWLSRCSAAGQDMVITVRQSQLLQLLRHDSNFDCAAAPPVQFHERAQVTSVALQGSAVKIIVNSESDSAGHDEEYDFVVAADGPRSVVARALPALRTDPGQASSADTGTLARSSASWSGHDVCGGILEREHLIDYPLLRPEWPFETLDDGGHDTHGMSDNQLPPARWQQRFALVPLSNGGLFWFCHFPRAAGMRPPACWHEQHEQALLPPLAQMFADYHDPVPRVIARALECHASGAAPIRYEEVLCHNHSMSLWQRGGAAPPCWRSHDRIVFLGDALQACTPNLAQGAALAIEDATELAACASIAKEREASQLQCGAAFTAYEARRAGRRARHARMTAFTGLLADPLAVAQSTSAPIAQALARMRDAVLSSTPRKMNETIFDVALSYSLGHNLREGVHAHDEHQ